MNLIKALLDSLHDGEVKQVNIGLHWTAVVTEVGKDRRCGLASTLSSNHDHHNMPDVPKAGKLETISGRMLAAYAQSSSSIMRSVGIAAINSLLEPEKFHLVDQNAEQAIVEHGSGKKVVLVGRFPFIPRLKAQLGSLFVLEIDPRPGELPAASAHEVIPGADVVAITGTTLINGSFERLLDLCSSRAFVILLGPSSPLDPSLFDHGVDLICGAMVANIEQVLQAVRQGANFRQVHQAGVRLTSLGRFD
jgi:uncharacterized protein (DUF4213/DUF364 family)